MFDLTSGKLLLLGIVALIVLGPKDFPILLRTIGKYMGIIKRQADEFRAQFDEAIRESEFDQIKKDVEGLGQDLDNSVRETGQSISSDLGSVTKDLDGIKSDVEAHLSDPLHPSPHTTGYTPEDLREPGADSTVPAVAETPTPADPLGPDPDAHDANGIPMKQAAEAPLVVPATDKPEPAVVHADRGADRGSLNGSGNHPAPAESVGETSPKSGA
jgi:sec-independent protein translocase protein TatB